MIRHTPSIGIGIGLSLRGHAAKFRGLLDSYAGAAAAYSLRKLRTGVTNVVRVRRSSDNAEADFTAGEAANGTLTDWVNSQVVPPLDIGVESGDGRPSVPDGGTSIGTPAAAYSLRSLGEGQADDIVPSGDTVTPAAGAYVVQVRRSSDDNVKSFTADEVSDGTLDDWVGTGNDGYVRTWYDQSGSDNHAVQTTAASQPKIVDTGTYLGHLLLDGTDDYFDLTTDLTAQPYSTFSVYSATQNSSYIYSGESLPATGRRSTGAYIMHHGFALAGGTHPNTEILGTYFANGSSSEIFSNGASIVSGNAGNTSNTIRHVFGRPGNTFGGTASELIIYNSDQSANRAALEANIGEYYGITGIPAYDNTVDGYVETWYDQSGNGNDATQATAASQPKIVDAGVIVKNGGKPAIKFDGVDDALASGNLSVFELNNITGIVVSTQLGGGGGVGSSLELGAGSNRFGVLYRYSNTTGARYGSEVAAIQPYSYTEGDYDLGLFVGRSTDAEMFINGSSIKTYGTSVSASITSAPIIIGGGFTGAQSVAIPEAIAYDSDQSANRAAIEANINNHYSIY